MTANHRLSSSRGVAEANKAAASLVPQREERRGEAAPQGERRDRVELVHDLVGVAQPVIGDAGIEMVDVMEADVAGQPVQHPRQVEP